MSGTRDSGDAVPPGVAPETPAPLTREDRAVRERLEEMAKRGQGRGEEPAEQTGQDG